MFSKSLIFILVLFFTKNLSFGFSLLDNENFALSLDTYLRTDVISFKNVVDLDSHNRDDHTIYLGVDYSLGFHFNLKERDQRLYLKLERNGPSDYSTPLFVHNTLMNTGGVIEEYRNDELLPQLEEFWWDTPLYGNLRFKIGLYTYEVGNVFSLNGAYENYGFTISRESENVVWRLYYCRPDLVYMNHLGPRIRQDEEQSFDYNHNAANFFAADAKFNIGKNYLQPYVGVLADYTSPDKRSNFFTAPIKKDILGTMGFALNLKRENLSLAIEAARNFGKGQSSNPEFKDVYHTGYMFYTDIDYSLGKITPSLQFFLGSGNKVSLNDATSQATTLTSGKNRAFSYGSPLNDNLSDSISASHSDIRPVVAMGSGYGLNYGVPRPRTFAIADFDNIIITSPNLNLEVAKNLSIGLYGYYLRSFEKGVGTLNGEAKRLSYELGYEADLSIDYELNKNVLISFLGGYFIPGKYHKELRDDTAGSLFSPFARGDGNANSAYQIELSVEFNF